MSVCRARQLRGVGGRLAGCAGHPAPSPPPDGGESPWGFSALGGVCSCSVGARAGRKHGSSGGEKPSGTWAHFTLSPQVTSHLQPHPSRVSDMHLGASSLPIHPFLALPWLCQQPEHLASQRASGHAQETQGPLGFCQLLSFLTPWE